MKKFGLLTAIAVVAMFMTSCEMFGEGGFGADSNKARFIAYTEKASRTTMGNNYSVLWSEGDAITLLGITSTELAEAGVLELSNGAGTQSGVFEGDLKQKYDNYYAYYPAENVSGAYAEGLFVAEYPTDAIYTERNFVDGANPMVAAGNENDGLQFRNLCGILELQLTGSGNITNISVEVGNEDPAISGEFVIYPTTYEAVPYISSYKYISAQLVEPVALSSTSRSIYAILPPGEYNELRITTYDESGNATTRLAKNTITIERSMITPVSEFDHQTIEKPHVTATYIEEKSNFATVCYRAVLNNLAAGYKRALLSDAVYQNHVNEGMTDMDILQNRGSDVLESGDYRVNVEGLHGQKVVFLFAAYDENGNWGDVQKLDITVKDIPVDESYSVTIRQNPTITSNSITAYFDAAPDAGVFNFYLAKTSDLVQWTEVDYELSTARNYGVSLSYSGGVVDIVRNALESDTEYTLIYRVASGVSDGIYEDTYTAYSSYKTFTFKTEAYEYANLSLNLSVLETKDWSIKVGISCTGASKYKLFATSGTFENVDIENIIDTNGEEINGAADEYTFTGLTEGTTYHLYAIAYDVNGKYSRHSVISATTEATITPEANAEYSKFLGTYKLTATGIDGSRTVTISQGIEGKTFLVKGLLDPALLTGQYGVVDDTIVARFYDNEIHIGSTKIADKGSVLPYDIWCAPYSDSGYFWPGEVVSSPYNNGTLNFINANDSTFTGLMFYIGSTITDNQGYVDLYIHMVLTKKSEGGESSKANATENFTRGEEVNVTWK